VDAVLLMPRQGARVWYIDGNVNIIHSSDMPFDEHYESIHGGADSMTLSPNVNGRAEFELDFLGIWKRILDESEIKAIWNGGAGLAYVKATVFPTSAGSGLVFNNVYQ
jgi:hypothetical protein